MSRKVLFIHFGDVYKINLAPQFKTLIDSLKKEHDPIITFGGDFVAPSLMSTFSKGKHMTEILNEMNIDYGCFGNHEFDYGVKRLHELVNEKTLSENKKKMNVKWIMSNLLDPTTKKPICDALEYEIITKNNIKIGLFSLVENWTEQAGLTPKDSLYLDYENVGKTLCKKLRNQEKCNVIIVLTHNLLAIDRKMSKVLPDVDLFLGAHDHIKGGYYDKELKFLKAGYDFEDLSLVEINISEDSKISIEREIIEVKSETKKNEKILEIISNYEDEMNKQMSIIIGSTKVDLDCRKNTVRGREAAFGNLLADFMKKQLKTDTTIIIGGIISSDKIWEKGDLSMGFVVSIFPWEGTVIAIEITGKDIILALENGVSWLPREDGRFIQVSGITMEYDIRKKKMERVSNVKINGENIDLERLYSVAVTDFIALGGEGFTMFANAKRLMRVEDGIPQIDLLKKLIEENSPLHPTIDGRLTSLSEYVVEDI
eukprot:gene774-9024_t